MERPGRLCPDPIGLVSLEEEEKPIEISVFPSIGTEEMPGEDSCLQASRQLSPEIKSNQINWQL